MNRNNSRLGSVCVIGSGIEGMQSGLDLADAAKPTEYLYGEDDRVLTHLELDEAISNED